MKKITFALLAALLAVAGCSKQSGPKRTALASQTDSVAYIIGLNIAANVMKMDSTINVDALCEGIRDRFAATEKLSTDEARAYYLRYVNYTLPERASGYEEQFLADIAENNRSFARTRTGITYSVESVGDQELIPQNDRDSVVMNLTISGADNEVRFRGDSLRRSLGEMVDGVKESLRLIGQGGNIDAWMPSKLAFGAEGNDSLGIKPNETLLFEIELIEVDKYATRRNRRK